MSENKFTPGPWAARIQRNGSHDDLGWIVEFDNGRVGWASLAYSDTNREAEKSDPAREANARLIAAAPDLYTNLEESNRNLVLELGINHPLVVLNRSVLAKARGENAPD